MHLPSRPFPLSISLLQSFGCGNAQNSAEPGCTCPSSRCSRRSRRSRRPSRPKLCQFGFIDGFSKFSTIKFVLFQEPLATGQHWETAVKLPDSWFRTCPLVRKILLRMDRPWTIKPSSCLHHELCWIIWRLDEHSCHQRLTIPSPQVYYTVHSQRICQNATALPNLHDRIHLFLRGKLQIFSRT